ncbi:MAG: 50S ribosomal protein L20 [Firmicutes bacterium]|nr:50S ribosomal protein L20 [Bacillota bacterium]
MPRVKSGMTNRARHKKVLKEAKGYFGSKHRLYKSANEQVMHAGKYAYRDRRQKKRDFRKLWITRINAACRENGISYSKFINGLSIAEITINRKMLSEIAIDNPASFAELVETAKKALEGTLEAPKAVKIKKETTKEVKVEKEETEDLSKKTVAELRELAKAKDIKGASTMKKAELIDALK